MSIYEPGLKNLSKADVASIMNWILDRAQGDYQTPLDSGYTAARLETPTLLRDLYQESDETIRQKLREALDLLLAESIAQKNFIVLTEIIFALGRIEYEFPKQILIQFIIEIASVKGDPEISNAKDEALALLQGYIKNSDEIYRYYTEWFWSDPITIGNEQALQLFCGLLARNPSDFPRLLIRLDAINQTLPVKDQFDPYWIWAHIVEANTEKTLTAGLPQLPAELQNQLVRLREEYPDLFNYDET